MRTGRISHQADGKPRGDQPTLLAIRRRFSASSARRRSITSVDTCRHHPRRSAIALLGAALALTAAACSDDGASTATTSEPPATSTTPAATTTEAATTTPASTVTTERAANGAIAEQVDLGGGRRIYLECRGTGSPTVVLQFGLRERRRHLERQRDGGTGGLSRPRRDDTGLHLGPARIRALHEDGRERDGDPRPRRVPPGP